MRIGVALPSSNVMYSWFAVLTTDVFNKFEVRSGGRTVCERLINHRCRHVIGMLRLSILATGPGQACARQSKLSMA